MNIFILSNDPIKAAQFQCNKHVVKMVLESAQLLCSVFEIAPYRRTHYNHPCSIWVRESSANFDWLIAHALALSDEYTLRYGKVHKSKDVILWCKDNKNQVQFTRTELTDFALVVPDDCRTENVVESYRTYYRKHKASMAKWSKVPEWFGDNNALC